MFNLFLVDDDQDVLDSLSWMLDGLGIKTHCFSSAEAFLDQVELVQAGIVILDIQMPGKDGIELLHDIKQSQSPLSVVMLSGHGTISMAVQAIQQGAIDFIEKPVDGDKLLQLLKRAQSETETAYSHLNQQSDINQRLASLTPREHEVLLKVLEGKLNKVIAAELNIAQRTIELHRQKVMQKMQVHNIAELVFIIAKSESI